MLDRRCRPKTRGQRQEGDASLFECVLDLIVGADIGAPKPIDRLLGVPDNEEFSGRGRDAAPIALVRVVCHEKQQDLGLQRVGVLKLVHKHARESCLERRAGVAMVSNEIPRFEQQVHEIQSAGIGLETVVSPDRLL